MFVLYFAELGDQKHLIRWSFGRSRRGANVSLGGMPFVVVGMKILECQHGSNRRRRGDRMVNEFVNLTIISSAYLFDFPLIS